jgi:hypothetical protein
MEGHCGQKTSFNANSIIGESKEGNGLGLMDEEWILIVLLGLGLSSQAGGTCVDQTCSL